MPTKERDQTTLLKTTILSVALYSSFIFSGNTAAGDPTNNPWGGSPLKKRRQSYGSV